MSANINPSDLSSVLVADPVSINGLPGYPATPTQVVVGGVSVNCSSVIECQSTTRGFLQPRMTNAQMNAIVAPVNGMQVFTTDAPSGVHTYTGGAWSLSGSGNVTGPNASTNNALSVFNGITGTLLAATSVLLNPVSSIISGLASVLSSSGASASPTYSFSGATNYGMFYTAGGGVNNALSFATNGTFGMGLNVNNTLSIGTNVFDATMVNGIQMSTSGATPTGINNVLMIYGATSPATAHLGIPGFRINAGGLVTTATNNTVNTKVEVVVNGTTYYLLASTSPA